MTDARAISAQLVDIRNVGTHKVVKLTLHAPEEQAMHIMKLFGWPTGVNPIPVALARLNGKEGVAHNQSDQPTPETPPRPVPTGQALPAGADKRPMPLSSQAALRCKDARFRAFLRETNRRVARDEAEAREYVLEHCGISSRADIKPGTEAETYWLDLERAYDEWQTEERAFA